MRCSILKNLDKLHVIPASIRKFQLSHVDLFNCGIIYVYFLRYKYNSISSDVTRRTNVCLSTVCAASLTQL